VSALAISQETMLSRLESRPTPTNAGAAATAIRSLRKSAAQTHQTSLLLSGGKMATKQTAASR
jgi:hypothetical protein